ncbi:hypothetical protein [Paraclostridium bifermentans]|uniref:hypothetical protein n=1 Tax=Paraclostridium bifermentans TaxID=1490 RepID=UPI001FF5B7E1|nr:hypothetical protein [Paraclostridium bifermentans]UOW69604.1 hypothetical protein MTR78_16605 [Paraclostridium bifermentans]
MKEIERKNIIDLPYSLHDAKVNKIEITSDKVILYFNEGYYKIDNDCNLTKGFIEFNNVDLDYCSVCIFNLEGNLGKFSGEKFSLQDFVEKFNNLNFEIIDETYGYNQSKFFGYVYEEDITKEFIIEIYHFSNMKYITE